MGYTKQYRSDEVKFRIVVEYSPETKSHSPCFPELSGCCGVGNAEEVALNNTKEAIAFHLE